MYGGHPRLVETCPESEGIATKLTHYLTPLLIFVETCPESEGIATYSPHNVLPI